MNRVEEVFGYSYRTLVSQMYGICGELTEAEDVVCEAFVRAASKPARFEALDNPEAWLRTVAINVARSRHRRRVLGERLLRRQYEPPAQPRHDAESVDLVRALQQLPAPQREAIVLHHLVDLSVAQVAEAVSAPAGTVKARLARGRAALADLVGATNDSSAPMGATTSERGQTHA